jgi:hypothetical protein
VDRRGGEPATGISASARSASAGARRIDRLIGSREITAGIEPARRNGKVATLTVGLSHDVSTVFGIGFGPRSEVDRLIIYSGQVFKQASRESSQPLTHCCVSCSTLRPLYCV